MPVRSRLIGALFLSLILVLSACGPGEQTATTEPTVAPSPSVAAPASPLPPSPTAVALAPSATPTRPAPSATPPDVGPSETPAATPTAAPPSLTLPPATSTAAPSPLPPTATPPPPPPPPPTPAPTRQQGVPANLRLQLTEIVGGLDTPVGIANAGDGSGRLFVVEKVGRIRIVRDGRLSDVPFLDITARVGSSQSEQGLLGLAFHPNYAANGSFFVNYTDRRGNTTISRFQVSGDPDRADPGSESILLRLIQPAANHNGGHLAFGPDGYLYIGTGDGGGGGDTYGNGQNGQTLLGAMLRLDIDSAQPYAIPPDNPFRGDPNVRDEIWALGLRNPWRYAFDRLTGDLYIADVGQNLYEEIDYQAAGQPGGQNYGWPIMEGFHCYPQEKPCDQAGLTLPIVEYDHQQGCSVTGGYVYRGSEYPALQGIYVFGDYCSGRLWGLAPLGGGDWEMVELARADLRLSSFGQDEAGELYVLGMGQGKLFKISARTGQ